MTPSIVAGTVNIASLAVGDAVGVETSPNVTPGQ
jgi:hypothetical protein